MQQKKFLHHKGQLDLNHHTSNIKTRQMTVPEFQPRNLLELLQQAESIKDYKSCISTQINELRGEHSSKSRLLLSPREVSHVLQWMFHHFLSWMLWTMPWSCGSFANELDETKWGAHYGSMQINDSDSNIWRKLCHVRWSFLSIQHELFCWAAGAYPNSLISYEKKNVTCVSKKKKLEWDKWGEKNQLKWK